MASITDIQPIQRASDLVSDDELRSWIQSNGETGEEVTIPWEADPSVMTPMAAVASSGEALIMGAPVDPAIVFGADTDADFKRVTNWVQVDDLGGLGNLYCGSFGGKFYLSTVAGESTATEDTAPTAATNGEQLSMTPVALCDELSGYDAGGYEGMAPRVACPMSERENVLKVNGKWRSDIWWDTLINGITCMAPPEYSSYSTWTNKFRRFTLRLAQVGQYLCFHTTITTPKVTVTKNPETEEVIDWEVEAGDYFGIGYSGKWHGLPRINWGTGMYSGFACAEGTAEPPWGSNISQSWQGEDTALAAAGSAMDSTWGDGCMVDPDNPDICHTFASGYPYCRVYPRVNASAGWVNLNNINPTLTTSAIAEFESYLFGVSPEWCEERLGISDAHTRAGVDWPLCNGGEPDHSCYRHLSPAGTWVRVFQATLPLSPLDGDQGSVYLALYTATIDNSLLTASIFAPHDYMSVEASTS